MIALVLATALAAQEPIPAPQQKRIREAAPEKATAVPKRARRVLVWITRRHLMAKDPHKGYSIPYGTFAVETLGRKTAAFEPVVSDDLSMFLPETLRGFDAVVMNNSSGPWITPTEEDLGKEAFRRNGATASEVESVLRKSLLDYVESGGGVVAWHFAIGANRHWPEFQALLGGRFVGHPWNEEVGVRVEEPSHPLVAAWGGKDFRIADEIYQFGPVVDRTRIRVLVSIDPERTNMAVKHLKKEPDFPLAWVRSAGKGRVFYTSFGHRTECYWNPGLLRFYLDAIQFACGDLEAPASPRD